MPLCVTAQHNATHKHDHKVSTTMHCSDPCSAHSSHVLQQCLQSGLHTSNLFVHLILLQHALLHGPLHIKDPHLQAVLFAAEIWRLIVVVGDQVLTQWYCARRSAPTEALHHPMEALGSCLVRLQPPGDEICSPLESGLLILPNTTPHTVVTTLMGRDFPISFRNKSTGSSRPRAT